MLAIACAAAWVAAGALFKLFSGSPNDLPPDVQELFRGRVWTFFRAAIAVELCVVIFALLRPSYGWIPLVGLFLVFDAVLVPLVRSGATSCGCFGSKVPIPPWAMMTIDSVLLVAILATRPWRLLGARALRPLPLLPLFAGAVAAPWFFLDSGTIELPTDATASSEQAEEAVEAPAVEWPDYHELRPDEWLGKDLDKTELAVFLREGDLGQIPVDATVIFYRQSCEYCKDHLEALAMAQTPETAEESALGLVLVRIPDADDLPENEKTKVKPDAIALLELRMLERGYGGFTPPAEMKIEGFVVTSFDEIEHEQ